MRSVRLCARLVDNAGQPQEIGQDLSASPWEVFPSRKSVGIVARVLQLFLSNVFPALLHFGDPHGKPHRTFDTNQPAHVFDLIDWPA
jgi:hypothetical protein